MSSSLTRRQVTKGAAWAVPIVAASAAIPAYAASPKPEYELAGSWYAENAVTYGDCPAGSAYYDQLNFTTATSVNGAPAGFAVRGYAGTTETATVTLNRYQLSVALPAGLVSSINVTSGAYTVSGPTQEIINGEPFDVFVFTYTGTTTGTTIPEGATSPSWPNSQLQTSINFDSNTCYPALTEYYVAIDNDFTTDNGYTDVYSSPWIASPMHTI